MKIGLMNNPLASVYDEVISFAQAGYDFVDLTIEGPNAVNPDPERIRGLIDQFNLSIVGHTDPCLPYAYPVESVRKACFEELERCAKIFSAAGAMIMNIHPCYDCPPAMKEHLVRLNIKALKPLAAMVASYGLTLVLENFRVPFDSVSTCAQVMQEVPGLNFHLDFGHANLGKDDGVNFCSHMGRHIKHVHFSDNRGTEDDHLPLGVGNIDWGKAVSALKTIGYDGTITLEVFCDDRSSLFKYLEVSRRLVIDLWNREKSMAVNG
jgi:sugar phosphate isomerase/epimerase